MDIENILAVSSTIIVSIGGAGLMIRALSGWLGKLWLEKALISIRQENSLVLQKEKAQLNIEIEAIKNQIASNSAVMQTKFNSLHEKRLDAISDNSKALASVWLKCRYAIQPDEIGRDKPPIKERLEEAAKELDKYFENFESTRIFFSKETHKQVYDFIFVVWKSLDALRIHSLSNDELEEKLASLYGEWVHDLKPRLDKARESIENEYMSIIEV